MKRPRLYSLFLFAAVVPYSLAAPPTVTYLYPAGAQRGTTVDVAAAGTLDASAKFWVDRPGATFESAKGKLKVTIAKDAVPGTYWLRANNPEGASSLRPFIVGILPELTETEPNDEPRKPQVLTGPSAVVNGKLGKNGDVDCFAIPVKKGQTLVASLEANHTLRSPMDGMLQVLTADGFVLEENNDFHGLDPQITYTPQRDGMYIVRAYAFPSTPDSSIRYFGSDACVYRLTLTTGAFSDYSIPLAVNQVGPMQAELSGWNLSPGSRQLMVASGESDERFARVFGEGIANPLRLRLESHPVHGLKLTTPLKPPFSATGRIMAPKGESLIPFEGKKGQALTIQVESRSLGLAVNPIVRILDGEKQQLARAEPGKLNTDTTLAFTPPSDGVYTVGVRDLFAGGGSRHAFLLRVLAEPDYELTVAADRFTIAAGKVLTIPVKVNRIRGFRKPVELIAHGLPDSVKVDVTVPAKPDPGNITLSLMARQPWLGSFQLIGRVKDEPKLTWAARFPMPEFGESTSRLWLTVTPK